MKIFNSRNDAERFVQVLRAGGNFPVSVHLGHGAWAVMISTKRYCSEADYIEATRGNTDTVKPWREPDG